MSTLKLLNLYNNDALGTPTLTIGTTTNSDVIFKRNNSTIITLGSGVVSTTTDLVVGGNLTVNGTTTTVNSTTLTVDDKNIELGATVSPSDAAADGGGITLKGTTDKSVIWDVANSNWTSSEHFNLVAGKSYKINNVALAASHLSNGTTGTGAIVLQNGGTINGFTLGGAVTGNSQNVSGLGTLGCGAITSTGDSTFTAGLYQPMTLRRPSTGVVELRLQSQNASAAYVSYGAIRNEITDTTAGSEDGGLSIHTMAAGAQAQTYTFVSNSLTTAASVTSLAFNAGNPSLNIGTGALTAGSGTFSGALTLGSNSTSLNHIINNADLSSGGISIQAAGVTKGWLGPARAYYADGAGDVDMSIVSNGASVRIGTGSGGSTVHTFSSTGLAVTGTGSYTGNLGVGANISGSYALEVNGKVVARRSTDNNPHFFAMSNSGSQCILESINNLAASYLPMIFRQVHTGGTTDAMTLDASGNLAVDTNTLYVDAVNNRVGVGTASPAYTLDVRGNIASVFSGPGYQAFISDSGGANNSYLSLYQAASAWILTANKNGSGTRKSISISTTGGDTTVADLILDTSGNLGLGVTPNAGWANGWRAVQLTYGALSASGTGVYTSVQLSDNAYFNGSGANLTTASYIASSNPATNYKQYNGTHTWYTAPSGTAGNAITWTTAMTLDASGNLGVGVSSTSGYRARIRGEGTTNATRALLVDNSSGSALLEILNDGAINFGATTPRMTLDAGGNLLVAKGTSGASTVGVELRASGAVISTRSESTGSQSTFDVYSTGAGSYRFYVDMTGTVFATSTTISAISDRRHKENIRDLDVGLSEILALKPRVFDWKEGKGKNTKNDRGFIAQEFEQVFPDLIDVWKDPAPEGEEPYKSVRQDLIPVLVKAIQELSAKNDALEARLAALESA